MSANAKMTKPAGASGIDLDEMVAKFRPVVGFKVKKALGGWNPEWEDVVNEILMQAVEKIKSGEFRGESAIGTYIYTIAKRRIIDYIRQKTRPFAAGPEISFHSDPHEELERSERAKRLAEAVKRLPPKYRDVLYLYYYKNLSRDEVACKLGLKPARISERINYAQKLLRKRMAGRFPFF